MKLFDKVTYEEKEIKVNDKLELACAIYIHFTDGTIRHIAWPKENTNNDMIAEILKTLASNIEKL